MTQAILALTTTARRAPSLAVVCVGDDPASEIYVANKRKACADSRNNPRMLTIFLKKYHRRQTIKFT